MKRSSGSIQAGSQAPQLLPPSLPSSTVTETRQAPGLWTCCRLRRRRHVTKATHTHTRTLATPTSSANRAAAAALRCSLTGFNVFSFFFLLLVEKEKLDTGTTGTGHPQGQHPRGSTPLGRGRWRSVATAPALAMHWRALQSRLHRGKSGDSVSSTADGPATLFSSRSEQGADVTFTPPPPPLPPGVSNALASAPCLASSRPSDR